MKIRRDDKAKAKSIFKVCLVDGKLQPDHVRKAVSAIIESRPRNTLQILSWFKHLVDLEIKRQTLTVESAVALSDSAASIFAQVEQQFGPAMVKNYAVNPDLIGGLRIQKGSDVWDGSIRQRLSQLQSQLS